MIEKISKYRSALMGAATLMVVAYHYRLNFNSDVIRNIASIGYSGVDIFLFVSGFGLFCGYCKRPDGFLLRRFLRVYPTYLLYLVVLAVFSSRYTIGESLLASTGIGYYLPFSHIKWFDWYIPTMFLLYGLFPLMAKLIAPPKLQHSNSRAPIAFVSLGLLGILLTVMLIVFQKGTVMLTVSRIPIFVLGTAAGYCFMNGYKCKAIIEYVLIAVCLIALPIEIYCVNTLTHEYLWRNAIYFLPFLIITPGIILICVKLFLKLPNVILGILSFVGSISMEVYLIHLVLLGSFEYTKSIYGFPIFIVAVLFVSYCFKLGVSQTIKCIDDAITKNRMVRRG